MALKKRSDVASEWKELIAKDEGLREVIQEVVQEVLEAEMDEALGAGKWERTDARMGYRAGYYPRTLVTRVGKLELRVPQDRHGRFSTEVFERYQRSEKALVVALAEMYVQGVSTRLDPVFFGLAISGIVLVLLTLWFPNRSRALDA